MATYGQNKLNKNDVRNGIFRFLLSFMILTCVTFLSVFLFYKSSDVQTRQTKIKADQYFTMQNTVFQLNSKLDRIIGLLGNLNNGTEGDYSNVSQSVIEDIRQCKKLIGKDTADYKLYTSLLNQIERNIMPHKKHILSSNEKLMKVQNRLADCEKTTKRLSTPDLSPLQQRFGKK